MLTDVKKSSKKRGEREPNQREECDKRRRERSNLMLKREESDRRSELMLRFSLSPLRSQSSGPSLRSDLSGSLWSLERALLSFSLPVVFMSALFSLGEDLHQT